MNKVATRDTAVKIGLSQQKMRTGRLRPYSRPTFASTVAQNLALVLFLGEVVVIGGIEARPQNTCRSQSAMHHGVPVRVFFRRSSEHHSRNDSSSSTSWSHDSHVFFSHSRTLVVPGTFLRVLYNIHHHVAFARELEEKKKNTEQH